MSDNTELQMQRLSELGILSESRPGHVVECHVHGDQVGWHCLRTISDFVAAWPQRPTLIPLDQESGSFVALFSELGVQIFEYENSTACEVAK